MKIQLKGKIENVNTQSGVSAKGNEWKKREVLLKTSGRDVLVSFFDSQDNFGYLPDMIGDTITIDAEIESREYKGKYYTQVNGLGVIGALQSETPETRDAAIGSKKLDKQFEQAVMSDDLPF